jgi:hypothetical protein
MWLIISGFLRLSREKHPYAIQVDGGWEIR